MNAEDREVVDQHTDGEGMVDLDRMAVSYIGKERVEPEPIVAIKVTDYDPKTQTLNLETDDVVIRRSGTMAEDYIRETSPGMRTEFPDPGADWPEDANPGFEPTEHGPGGSETVGAFEANDDVEDEVETAYARGRREARSEVYDKAFEEGFRQGVASVTPEWDGHTRWERIWGIHDWTRWSEPVLYQVTTRRGFKGETEYQERTCIRCGLKETRRP